jgi:H/ACA ribonucleoprotein complex subunit 3
VKTLLRKCGSCRSYTMMSTCPKCGGVTFMSMPAKYSPDDRYGEYRRRLKKELKGKA